MDLAGLHEVTHRTGRDSDGGPRSDQGIASHDRPRAKLLEITVQTRYCFSFSCSIAVRISGTTSGQKRVATASNRVAISRVHLTAKGSGLNRLLPKRMPRPSAADSSEPIVTAAFKQASWVSVRMRSTMSAPPWPAAAKSRPARLGGAPFVIPDLETADVQQKGPSAKVQRDPFHQQLVLREDRVAGVARFAAAWTTRKPSDTVMWQAPVPDLALDEKTERFLVHSGLAGSGGRERTPNSPGSRRPEAPTRKARCRRREGSTKLDAPGSARTRRVRVRLRTKRNFMSRTDPTALTDALFAQRSLTRRAIQASGPAVVRGEGPATAALGR